MEYDLRKLVRRTTGLAGFLVAVMYFATAGVAHASVSVDWYKQVGSAGNDYYYSVASDGSVYVVGSIDKALPGQTYYGLSDAFIQKYDANGVLQWTHQFGTALDDRATGVASDGNYVVVVGTTDGTLPGLTSHGGRDMFIRTYLPDGTLITNEQVGTAGADEARAVSISDNYLYVTGSTDGSWPGFSNSGDFDAFVQKYHVLGSLQWTSQFGTAAFDQGDTVLFSATDSSVYVSGTTDGALDATNQGSSDVFVRKYDINGNVLWKNQFGSSGYDLGLGLARYGSYLYLAGDTGAALPGQTSNGGDDGYVQAYSPSTGSVAWTRQFGTAGFDEAATVAADETGVYVAGFVDGAWPGQTGSGGLDIYLRKFDTSGNDVYTKQLGTSGDEDVYGMAVRTGYIYLVGTTDGAWPGLTNAGLSDGYMLRMTQDADNDGIYDPVDLQPTVVSSDFSNGVTYGTVATSGDQILAITQATTSTTSIHILAAPGGGATPATITACGGLSTFYVNAGDSLNITCGSIIFNVFSGSVDATLRATNGSVAQTTISAGNTLDFEGSGAISTVPTNTDPLTVTAGDQTVTLSPGESGTMPVDMPISVSSTTLTMPVVAVGSTTALTATIDAPADDGSTIIGATYSIDGKTPVAMAATDGVYDSSHETVTAPVGPFTSAGVHELCVQATDSVNNTTQTDCVSLAVYDPSGGYVTGGGQFNSPVGAYTANPALVGTAHFGFVAKYETGAHVPVGSTEFHFQAGKLSFKSTSYDWLVVAGARAQYKGDGMVNNKPGYRFLLTAIDGDRLGGDQGDAVRIKIWNSQTGTVVYDNQIGAGDSATPSTTLTHGSIVIHTG